MGWYKVYGTTEETTIKPHVCRIWPQKILTTPKLKETQITDQELRGRGLPDKMPQE